MKLLSIDIETTGLDPEWCQIIEIGCCLFDPQPTLVKNGAVDAKGTRWQTWECLVKHDRYQGEPYALQLNQEIFAELAGVNPTHRIILEPDLVVYHMLNWLGKHIEPGDKVFVTGKNYGTFDYGFLRKLPAWEKLPLHHRVLDPGSLCFNPADEKIKSLPELLEDAGRGGLVTHRALDDALAVATLVTACFEAKLV